MTSGSLARLGVVWPDEARRTVRAIDRKTAMEIFRCIDRYLETRHGDVKLLRPPLTGLRLRCGDYRVVFQFVGDTAIRIDFVYHRREAYR